jgi:uncharacterized protein (UPF0332 family)
MKEDIKVLVAYRLEQADESLESAQILLDHDKYRPSINRAYYAMFYAVLALLAISQQQTSKHSGAISLFNRNFVKTGIFDKDVSRWLQEAFDLRQEADYRELAKVSVDTAKETLEHAQTFVARVKDHLKNLM